MCPPAIEHKCNIPVVSCQTEVNVDSSDRGLQASAAVDVRVLRNWRQTSALPLCFRSRSRSTTRPSSGETTSKRLQTVSLLYLRKQRSFQSSDTGKVCKKPCCHRAAKIPVGQEHCDDCMGCLAIQLQGSIFPITVTVFLAWRQHDAIMLSW